MTAAFGARIAAQGKVLKSTAYLTVIGLAGLAVMCVLGFEEPNRILLGVSSAALLAPPLTVLVHLGLTRDLSTDEKRIWLREFYGRRAPWAWSEYVACSDRARAARALAHERARRRQLATASRVPGAASDAKRGKPSNKGKSGRAAPWRGIEAPLAAHPQGSTDLDT